MKTITSMGLIALLSASLMANDITETQTLKEDANATTTVTQEQLDAVRVIGQRVVGIRGGFKSGSGTATVTGNYGSYDADATESGVEISIYSDKTNVQGWGYRPVITLAIISGEFADGLAEYSSTTLIGEFEAYYAFNKYFKPFVSIGAGFGTGTESDTTGFNESVGAVEFVIGAGVSGNIAEKIGYFVKLSSIGRSFAPNSYDTTVGAGIGATTVGITLEF